MREVDLIGLGRSMHFVTYRLPRFAKWIGVSPRFVQQWLAPQNRTGSSFEVGSNLVFETGGAAIPNIRQPHRTVRRWNLFWHNSKKINRSARVDYLGNLHAEWDGGVRFSELTNIEFCFLSSKGGDIREALRKGLVTLKLRT